LLNVEWVGLDDWSSEFHHTHLYNECQKSDHDEKWVVEYSFEYIQFS
jgi:hypothetical protein